MKVVIRNTFVFVIIMIVNFVLSGMVYHLPHECLSESVLSIFVISTSFVSLIGWIATLIINGEELTKPKIL